MNESRGVVKVVWKSPKCREFKPYMDKVEQTRTRLLSGHAGLWWSELPAEFRGFQDHQPEDTLTLYYSFAISLFACCCFRLKYSSFNGKLFRLHWVIFLIILINFTETEYSVLDMIWLWVVLRFSALWYVGYFTIYYIDVHILTFLVIYWVFFIDNFSVSWLI